MAKGFHIGDFVKEDVSKINPAPEKIEYIPLDDIHPDPDNFYSLDGIDELAENIALVGLLDPLRVRRGGEKAPYIVISGHRRRAACMLLRNGGDARYKTVPCIVQRVDDFAAREKLRLIFANSHTRVLSGAELAKQSKQVMQLLLELKANGMMLPGRMRDHVAEALNVSASKLARVQAIQNNLIPALLEEYDGGRMNESVAYRISQETAEMQEQLSLSLGPAVRGITAEAVEGCIAALRPKAEEPPPLPENDRTVGALETEPDARGVAGGETPETNGGPMRASAPTETWADKIRREKREAEDARCREMWRRCGIQRRRVGGSIQDAYRCEPKDVKRIRAMEDGGEVFFDVLEECSMTDTDIPAFADRLFCSLDYIFGRTDIPETVETFLNNLPTGGVPTVDTGLPQSAAPTAPSEREPEWQTGDPPEVGWFAVWARYSISPTRTWDPDYEVLYWTGEHWSGRPGGAKSLDYEVLGWWPLPGKEA